VGKRKAPRAAAEPAASSGAGRFRRLAAVGLVAAAAVLAWATWQKAPAPVTPPTSLPATPPANAGASSAAQPTPEAYAALVGEWVRSDGGYVLAVSAVAPDGKATVSYFNPRPIHVARAEAKLEGPLVGLFVELRDVNYPGSTYTLGFDSASDQLKGIYFQAAQGAQYEVAFSRRR
jgi:hypothetical protein